MRNGGAKESAIEEPTAGLRMDIVGIPAVLAIACTLAVITANECHYNFTRNGLTGPYAPSLLFGILTWLWWGAMVLILWAAARRWAAILHFSASTVLVHLAIACVLAVSHQILLQHFIQWSSQAWPSWGHLYSSLYLESPGRIGIDLLVYCVLYGVSVLMYTRSQQQRTLVQKLEVERQLSQAHLKALQTQMEPHFLFNTLNAVTSLVDLGRNKEASEALGHLDTILRSTLRRRAPEKIPFLEELRTVESYLAIQQVRFSNRLKVKIETTPEALEGLVPCFLLQPIVENAIHHGIAPLLVGGLIETSVKKVGNRLWMQIRDNGAGPGHASEGYGIGIRNTRERLAYFYPGTHEFLASARESGGYEVTIEIPFERAAV